MAWEAHHGWEAGLSVHGHVLEQQSWIRPCCHRLRGCSRCRASSSHQAPLLGEPEGSLVPRTALGDTVTAMPRARLAAWAGEAPALLAGLVPVRCIPADIPGQGGVPQEATSRVPTVLAKRLGGKSGEFFPHFKFKTSLNLLVNYACNLN